MVDVDDYLEIDGFGPPIVFKDTPTSTADTYERFEQIGFGAFGIVYRVQRQSDRRVLAIKELNNDRDGIEEAAIREYEISRAVDQRSSKFCRREALCITELYNDRLKSKIYLLVPLGEPRTLARYMTDQLHPPLLRLSERARQRQQPVFVQRVMEVGVELLRIVALLHSLGVRHRDIKEDNLLLSLGLRKKPKLRLIDFGFGCLVAAPGVPNGRLCQRGQGKVSPYTDLRLARAPRTQVNESRRAELQDVFACGATLYSAAMPREIGRIPPKTFDILEDRLTYMPPQFITLLRGMLGPWERRRSAAHYQLQAQNLLELL